MSLDIKMEHAFKIGQKIKIVNPTTLESELAVIVDIKSNPQTVDLKVEFSNKTRFTVTVEKIEKPALN